MTAYLLWQMDTTAVTVYRAVSQGFSCPDAGTLNLVISEVLTRLKL